MNAYSDSPHSILITAVCHHARKGLLSFWSACRNAAFLLTSISAMGHAQSLTYVRIPANNNIQTSLIDTIPMGIFTADNPLATTFRIPAMRGNCGNSHVDPCNYFDGFGFSGAGHSIVMDVSITNPTKVYTLMNAYRPAAGQQLAMIQFVGTGGAVLTFPLIGGRDIRDFYQSSFANNQTYRTAGVQALNAFSCSSPTMCRGSGGTGSVQTGGRGQYVIDEQVFTLGEAFAGHTLTRIILTDTYNGSNPILLGVTVESRPPQGLPAPQ